MMRALTQAERELDRVKGLRRIWAAVRRGTLSREVSESVHANTDERRHLGGSTSLNGAEDCIQNQSREVADNVALKYGSEVAESQINKEMKPWIIRRKPWMLQSQVTTNQYLKRCWTEHSDSMTSNRIWWKEILVIGMWTVPFGAEIVQNSTNDTTRRWIHEWHLN